jgi:predicted aspartyl protease
MKFPYRDYITQYPGTEDFRLILRPVVTIRIAGLQAAARWDALVDTGADETLLPLTLAELLGVTLDETVTSQAAGITGDNLTIQYGEVEFQLTAGEEEVNWNSLKRLTK